MKRIFGSSKPAGPQHPTLSETSDTMDKKTQHLQQKVDQLDRELMDYKQKMSKLKPGPAQNGLKQKALRVLKQKKMYEQQLNNLMNTQFAVDQTKFTLETAKDSVAIVGSLKEASQSLKTQLGAINVDSVYDLTDDLAELMEDNNMIQEALARSYDTDFIDETELENELEMLGDDLAFGENETPSYLSLPSASTTGPTATTPDKTAVPMGF